MRDGEIAAMRQDNKVGELLESSAPPEPWELFSSWFEIARKAKILEPNAMILSTVAEDGQPTSRVVLLKDFNHRGLVFFTNYLSQKGKHLTNNPRVYKMLSDKNEILYVGKAKNIPNRLKSYVSDSHLPIRTERMLSLTRKLETTTTTNESEALLLEANLIKRHKPRFNILLRDDKSFPYIFIGQKDKWPQLTKLRGKKNRDGYYFGPFASVGSANWTIKILQKIFLLRVCDDTVFKNRDRACILYQIRRCSAPCVGKIEEQNYKNLVSDAVDFISGKSQRIQKNLSKEMESASEDLDLSLIHI